MGPGSLNAYDPSYNYDPSASFSAYDPNLSSYSWMNDPSMWSGTNFGNYGSSSSSGSSSLPWDPSSISVPSAPPASTYSFTPSYSNAYTAPLDYTSQQAGNPSAQMYNYYMGSGGGNVGQAFQNAATDRWTGGATSLPTRNAEHALFSQYMVNSSPLFGPVGAATLPPLYNAAKYAAQNVPAIGKITNAVLPPSLSLTNATPTSWESLLWGWKPFWPQSYQPVR
jgi:hypothetical protein